EEQTLEAAWLRASERRAGGLEREGRLDEAIAVHNAVLAVDPFAEANVQALLRLLGAAGRRSEALTTYEAFRRILAEEFGAEPLETTGALADALRHSKAGRSTLPSPSTPLVGRRQELAALRDLLNRDDARLVTLLGLGGSGKTR